MKNVGTIVGVVLMVLLVVLLLGGAGMMGFGGFGMGPGMMNGGMMGGMMGGYGGMMGGYGTQSGFGFNPLSAIISLATWALVIGGIVWLVVWLARNPNVTTRAAGESAIEILKTRYARGEINKEQFDAIRHDLGA